MTPLNVLSLFSGIGGLELGLERAGMTVVGQVEMNPFCQQVLAKHWPEVPRHDDVRTAPAWWDSEPRPDVHVVCGGFPCQPFSLAGELRGVADKRWLWPAMAGVVRHVRPQYVVVENVASLVRDAVAFGWMLGDLAECGFDAEWRLLSAPDFGAPQAARERLLLVAYRPSLNGQPRDLLESGRSGRPSFAAGGLPRLGAPERRRRADQWLASEPRVARLADGIPHQVEQLGAYGNAVIPAIAEHIGRLITGAAS